jgi:nitroreductase/NAD-dependent dihydropyrimidine dehydrogenase PreA subunit
MSIITVNELRCKKCGICAQSCPVRVIDQGIDGKLPVVTEAKESSCIYCGHCESICPEGALTHRLTTQALEASLDKGSQVSADAMGQYFKNRRSIRQYQSKQVPKEVLEQIFDIVRYAPTGTNRQFNQWVVITEPTQVQKMASVTIDWMRSIVNSNAGLAARYNLEGLIRAFDKGYDNICRNAPCLVIGYTPASYPLGAKDAVIATSHFELLAPSFGLGACWAGFLMMALQNSAEAKKAIGLNEESIVQAALMVGYPKFKYYKVPARNAASITWL